MSKRGTFINWLQQLLKASVLMILNGFVQQKLPLTAYLIHAHVMFMN